MSGRPRSAGRSAAPLGLLLLAGFAAGCAAPTPEPRLPTTVEPEPHPHEYAPIEEVVIGDELDQALLILVEDFSGTAIDGRTVRLAEALRRHRVLLLTYFAEWCENCGYEAPELVRAWERYGERGFGILARSEYSHPAEVERFIERHRIPYPVLVGSPNPDPEVEDAVRAATSHYRLRRALQDDRKWGTPLNVLLVGGETERIWVVKGEFEPGALEAFLERRLP